MSAIKLYGYSETGDVCRVLLKLPDKAAVLLGDLSRQGRAVCSSCYRQVGRGLSYYIFSQLTAGTGVMSLDIACETCTGTVKTAITEMRRAAQARSDEKKAAAVGDRSSP